MKPTCDTDHDSGQYGCDWSRLDQLDQDQAERIQKQAGPEKPVDQGPGPARRGHHGAWVPARLGIVLLKAVLLTQWSHTSGIRHRQLPQRLPGAKMLLPRAMFNTGLLATLSVLREEWSQAAQVKPKSNKSVQGLFKRQRFLKLFYAFVRLLFRPLFSSFHSESQYSGIV